MIRGRDTTDHQPTKDTRQPPLTSELKKDMRRSQSPSATRRPGSPIQCSNTSLTPSSATTTTTATSSSSSPGLASSPTTNSNSALEARVDSKLKRLAAMQAELKDIVLQLQNPKDPQSTVDRHIKLLKQYNQVRDVGLGLIGLVAQQQGVTTQSVMTEYGLTASD